MQSALNIVKVYWQASAFEIDAGLRWYLKAHEEALRLYELPDAPDRPQWSVDVTSAMIAAVSPGLRWENNVEVAERIIRKESLEGLGVRWYDGVRKAEAIRDGASIDDTLKGNKVRSFRLNIAYPESVTGVTIDGHAYAIAAGERMNLDEVPSLSDRVYRQVEEAYQEAAKIVGILPHQLQAITWTTWRRLHSVSSAHYLPLFDPSASTC